MILISKDTEPLQTWGNSLTVVLKSEVISNRMKLQRVAFLFGLEGLVASRASLLCRESIRLAAWIIEKSEANHYPQLRELDHNSTIPSCGTSRQG